MRYFWIALVGAFLSLPLSAVATRASVGTAPRPDLVESGLPPMLEDVGIKDRPGAQVPLSAVFRTETGQTAPLSQLLKPGLPTLLTLVYYDCPNLCNLVLNGLSDGLKSLDWSTAGKFQIVSMSIDSKETPALARKKKTAYLEALQSAGKTLSPDSWHFLTGDEASVRSVADAVGFKFKWDPVEKQFAHGAAAFVLTPEGKLSRTLYGITFTPQTLKLALLEASSGKIGTVIDRILLFCYRYNSVTRTYSVVATRLMQVGALLSTLAIGSYLGLFWWVQIRRRKAQESSST